MLSRRRAEAKNLMSGQTYGEILRRGAPQHDTPQNHSDAVLAASLPSLARSHCRLALS